MEAAWNNIKNPQIPLKKNPPYACCGKPMVIEEDTSAQCYECGRNIWPAVPCATREHYFANGGRIRTPYRRIKYFREWMSYISGAPAYVDETTMARIKAENFKPTPQGLKKALKRLRLQKYYKGISYILSEITQKPIPDISTEDMSKAEWMFERVEGKIYYYPDVIYDIFHTINPKHPILDWIPRK